MKLLACLAAAAAATAFVVPASAATVTNYNISFDNGVSYAMHNPTPTVVGDYTDIFTFTLPTQATFSGSLSTQRLRDPSGAIVSDLDFTNVMLDNLAPFDNPLPGSDALEVVNLDSTLLSAGTHRLTVSYTVNAADATNGAGYSGPLNLAVAAVPESSTWAMFMGAFGLIGAGLRRRRSAEESLLA